MLISHAHRFVFVKPRKTAGTTVELALSPFLAPGDMATAIEADEEPRRQVAPGVLVGPIRARAGLWPLRLRDHSPLRAAFAAFPAIRGYRVASMCRNPWDRAVSQFFWSMRRDPIRQAPFAVQRAAFIAYTTKWGPRTWLDPLYGRKRQRALDASILYTVDGRLRLDFVIRFECLDADLAAFGQWAGLSGVPRAAGIAAKAGYRSGGGRWVEFFDDATRDLVARECATEIALFGYDFEGRATPRGPLPGEGAGIRPGTAGGG